MSVPPADGGRSRSRILVGSAIGLALGVTSAYIGGMFDLLAQRIVDAMMAAAYEMAQRGRERIAMDDSFNYQIIERCALEQSQLFEDLLDLFRMMSGKLRLCLP